MSTVHPNSGINGIFHTPSCTNEPVLGFVPGSPERRALKQELERQQNEVLEIPCVIGGKPIKTGNVVDVVMPCDHGHVLAKAHLATEEVLQESIRTAQEAKREWSALPWQDRAAIFLRAAALLAGPWRDRINASTMLGQGKTCHQAEIDAACELIDFWRFNAQYMEQILSEQPESAPGVWNRLDSRPLEGFVAAISPFNFTSIALNLPTAPAMMGNVAIWKPATSQLFGAWYGYKLLEEAGLPPGVINFVPSRGTMYGQQVIQHPDFAGLHFTGSTETFQLLWKNIGNNIANYRSYPRVVGETGGKDFILAHPSADPAAVATAILRGGYEYQGQKCSAASRIYLPSNLWPNIKERLLAEISDIKMGDVRDFSNFMGAVIDKSAFKQHCNYLDLAKNTANVVFGGEADGSVGYFIQPTLAQVDDPKHRLMKEEIFGPIVSLFVYPENDWKGALQMVDETSPYALTGAVFAQDRYAIAEASQALAYAAGNFYINDKPTGAVVGQQPFGGGRASGTNDKAGSPLNLMRWISPRTIKENLCPPTNWRYPFLG